MSEGRGSKGKVDRLIGFRDHGEFKLKLTNLDRELKTLKKDMKAKNEHCTKLEDELRQLHSANNDEVSVYKLTEDGRASKKR